VEVVRSLQQAGCTVDTHDPYVANGRNLFDRPPQDALLLLVPHREYRALSPRDFRKLAKESCLFYDLKSLFERKEIEEMGMQYRAL
jgi:UDP-N-acetyl-D-mannosaminuronate dehydrogenase